MNRGCDPKIHWIDGIYNIKSRSTSHIQVANYTNKHVTFNKGQCISHTEPPIDNMPQTSINNLTTKMIDEHVQSNISTPPLHTLPDDVRKSLKQLLEIFELQFAQDETSIGTTHLKKVPSDTGNSEPVPQRPHPITMTQYNWVRSEINKLLDAEVIHTNCSSWSAPIIVVLKGDGGKFLVIDYWALNKVTQEFIWPMPRIEAIFSNLNSAKYFTTLNLYSGYHHIPLNEACPQYYWYKATTFQNGSY